jgi:sirohydrochlorin ferrochelatase
LDTLKENKKSEESVGVVLVDHGSRESAPGKVLEAVASALSSLRPNWQVLTAHLELQSPDLIEAVGSCKSKGAERVLVLPYFIALGRHTSKDIPSLVLEATEKFDIPVFLAEPLGFDARLVEVVLDRLEDLI